MKLLDNFIAIFSPMMRSTLELGRLNRIWEDFNNGATDTLNEILKHKWKYHREKVELLITVSFLTKK